MSKKLTLAQQRAYELRLSLLVDLLAEMQKHDLLEACGNGTTEYRCMDALARLVPDYLREVVRLFAAKNVHEAVELMYKRNSFTAPVKHLTPYEKDFLSRMMPDGSMAAYLLKLVSIDVEDV